MSETPIAKTGRKGDPRMHRAVAARLANPNLSLFQALKEGGFDYADDEDGSCLDGDNVKLGQRKNQLSRRVRLARKHDLDSSGNSSNGKKARKGDVDESDYLNQQALLEEEMKNMDDMQESNARTIRAKFHPDYHPLVLQPHLRASAATASSFFNATPHSTFASAPMFSFGAGGAATGASGVAVASLTRTASSIGMTLEQLALVLQNPQILAQLVQSATDATAATSIPTSSPARASSSTPAWQLTSIKDIALAVFRSKCRSLYEASMLQAGFPVEDTKEQSQIYLQFAWEAWQDEGKRLQKMIFDETNARVEFEGIHQKQESTDSDHHDHDHEKRHIHRLEGKCGHRAILHQPPNGIPHIDFVVGDTVECYQGHKPSLPIWPSKYSCQDLSCELDACNSETQSLMTPMNLPDPKIFRMDEINIDGKEWVSDFNNDETIVGLIKLGDSV